VSSSHACRRASISVMAQPETIPSADPVARLSPCSGIVHRARSFGEGVSKRRFSRNRLARPGPVDRSTAASMDPYKPVHDARATDRFAKVVISLKPIRGSSSKDFLQDLVREDKPAIATACSDSVVTRWSARAFSNSLYAHCADLQISIGGKFLREAYGKPRRSSSFLSGRDAIAFSCGPVRPTAGNRDPCRNA